MHAFMRTLARLGRHTLVVAALSLSLAVAGAASVSVGVHYSGKAKNGGKLSFRTTSTSVVGFKTSVNALCVSVAGAMSKLYVYPVLLQSPTRLKKGHFTITFKGSSSTRIIVTGIVKEKSASGNITVNYSKTLGVTSTGLLAIGSCSAKTTWTAKKA